MKIFYILILITASVASHAGIYKWVDKDGRTQYSQSPPNKSSKEMDLRPSSIKPKDKEAAEARIKNQQKFLKALNEDKEAKKKIAQENAQKLQEEKEHEKYCKGLRDELHDMEIGGIAWYKIDDKGERKFLSEEDVKKQKQTAHKRIKEECGDQSN